MTETDDEIIDMVVRGPGDTYAIHLTGEIDGDTADAFSRAVLHFERRAATQGVVPVRIQSAGGCVYSALAIVDAMEASALEFHTIAVGQCMSAAVMILCSGVTRWVSPHATIMLHDVHIEGLFGRLQDAEIETQEARRLNTLMWSMLATKANRSADFFTERVRGMRSDHYVTPQEAVEIGLVDHIGIPRLEATVRLVAATQVGGGLVKGGEA